MLLKLKFESEKPVNFQFGDVGVVVGKEPTEVEDSYAQALLTQYPDWVKKTKEKPTVADVVAN